MHLQFARCLHVITYLVLTATLDVGLLFPFYRCENRGKERLVTTYKLVDGLGFEHRLPRLEPECAAALHATSRIWRGRDSWPVHG